MKIRKRQSGWETPFFRQLVTIWSQMKKKGLACKRLTPSFLWWARTELNCRHTDFQSVALPTELPAPVRRAIAETESFSIKYASVCQGLFLAKARLVTGGVGRRRRTAFPAVVPEAEQPLSALRRMGVSRNRRMKRASFPRPPDRTCLSRG
jgi:hypothetical protein